MKIMKNKDEATKSALADFLKEKRKEKNLNLEKLSELTKIQAYHLEVLESGEFDKLPPTVYRKGIFKRVAKFLDIDEKEIMEMYKNESRGIEDASYNNSDTISERMSYFILTPKKITVFFGGILFVLLFAYLWYQFNFLVGPPSLVIEPGDDIIVSEESLFLQGQTESGVNLTVNGESVYVSSDGSFSKNIQLAAGINVIEIKSVNNFGKTTKVVRQIFRE